MSHSPHSVPGDENEPGELMAVIAQRLKAHGLEIREHYHGEELVEVAVTNPRDPDKGRVCIGYDGRLSWEYCGEIDDRSGADKIIATTVGLLCHA